ncbi:MAG TPA: NADPH-dependent FMN reductase [Tepidisphaeraceae bacterium]|jgi:NAD(P)H-dependent FMN reductase
MADRPILIIAGTNRPNANALRIAKILAGHYAKQPVAHEVFSLTDLPKEMFDPSAYASKPPAVQALQQRVLDALGLHVITPEYNGSFPGALKYFIDMLKFPESFDCKPVAFVGEANGAWGGLRAVEHLQGVFGYRNAHIFPERVFIASVKEKFDAEGNIVDTAIDERLARQAQRFAFYAQHMQTCGPVKK